MAVTAPPGWDYAQFGAYMYDPKTAGFSGSSYTPYQPTVSATYKPGLRMPPYVAFQNPDVSAKNLNDAASDISKQQSMFNAEGGVIPLIYGRSRIGAKLFVVTQYQGDLLLGCLFCEGEIQGIESIDINDIASTDTAYTAVTIETYSGTTTQTASPLLSSALPGYTDTLRYTETASSSYAVIRIPAGVGSGFPRIAAVIQGKKIYDPRDANQIFGTYSTYKYSNNPALCIADLITSKVYGLGKSVDWTSVALTANFCDRYVGNVGSQEVSRQLDLAINQEQEVSQWIEVLRGYASCFVIEENGIYTLIPDKPIGYGTNFKGVNTSFAKIPYNAAHSVTGEFSYEFSCKADISLTASATICLIAKGSTTTSGTNHNWGFYHNKTAGTSAVVFTIGLVNKTRTFTHVIPTNKYQTISVSYRTNGNGAGQDATVEVYFDGVPVTLAAGTGVTGSTTNTVNDLVLGGGASNGGVDGSVPYFGQIDEVRVWNRYRPLAEVVANWNRAIITKYDPSLVVHIPFNEGFDSKSMASSASTWTVASTAADRTGYTTGATIYPTPTYGTASTNWSQYDNPADFFRFDQNNILADSVKFKRRGVANVPTIVEIAYTDQTSRPWREDYARLDASADNNYKRRVSSVSLPGIIRYTQAYREAVERYNNIVSDSTVLFGAWDDSLALQVSDGIQFHHPIIEAWDQGAQAYVENFKPYRITSIREKEYSKFDIVAVEYDPQNYSDLVATAPTYPDTNIPKINNPPAPSNLVASETIYKSIEGVWGSRITATITPSTSTVFPYTQGFLVKLYKNTGVGTPLIEQVFVRPNATAPSSGTVEYLSGFLNPFDNIENTVYPVYYTLKVYTISTINVPSEDISADIAVYGKYTVPSNVTNLQGWEYSGKVVLKWDEAIDVDIWRYDIRYAPNAADTSDAAVALAYLTGNKINLVDSLSLVLDDIPSGTWRFMVCAVDSVGQYSAKPAYVDVSVVLDGDAYGMATRKFDGWTGLNLNQWTERPDTKSYWSTDFADHWRQGESVANNETASFSLTTGALEDVHTKVLVMDGTTASAYVSIPRVAGHDAASSIFTIEAYIYVNGVVSGINTVFSTMKSNDTGSWTLEVGQGQGTYPTDYGRLVFRGTSTYAKESANNWIKPNTWHHVCAKVNGTTVQLYVDTCAFNTTTDRIIGAKDASRTNPFCGSIKRVKWYSQALSDTDRIISSEYSNNLSAPTGLVGCWIMAEGTGTTITDTVTLSNGSLTGSGAWTEYSYFMSSPWDYGTIIAGNWTLSANITNHSGGIVNKYIMTSTDNTSWSYWPSSPVRTTARYVKAYINTTGNITITDWPVISLSLEPKSETITATTITSGGKLVQLNGTYGQAKSIQVTPLNFGTSTSAVAISTVVDRVLVATEVGLKATSQVTAATGTATFVISTSTYTPAAGRNMEFDAWLPPDTADLAANWRIVVSYSSAGATTHTPTLSSGVWVAHSSGVSAQAISSVSVVVTSAVIGIHSIVLRNIRITSGGVSVKDYWTSGEPTTNTTSGTNVINTKCGPANSFMVYAFEAATPTTLKAVDVAIKFDGS
jgi:hypothetical protein